MRRRAAGLVLMLVALDITSGCGRCPGTRLYALPPLSLGPLQPSTPRGQSVALVLEPVRDEQPLRVDVTVPVGWHAMLVLVRSDGSHSALWHHANGGPTPVGMAVAGTLTWSLTIDLAGAGLIDLTDPTARAQCQLELLAFRPGPASPSLPPDDLDDEQLLPLIETFDALLDTERRREVAGIE